MTKIAASAQFENEMVFADGNTVVRLQQGFLVRDPQPIDMGAVGREHVCNHVVTVLLNGNQAVNTGNFSTIENHIGVLIAANHERFVGDLPPFALVAFQLNFHKVCRRAIHLFCSPN